MNPNSKPLDLSVSASEADQVNITLFGQPTESEHGNQIDSPG